MNLEQSRLKSYRADVSPGEDFWAMCVFCIEFASSRMYGDVAMDLRHVQVPQRMEAL